jgi:hypothetical protein
MSAPQTKQRRKKRAGPRVGKFRVFQSSDAMRARSLANLRDVAAKDNLPDALLAELAEVPAALASRLIAGQRCRTSREVAVALDKIASWAHLMRDQSEPLQWEAVPWRHLPIGPTSFEDDPMRAALTLVGLEAKAAMDCPSRANLDALAAAANCHAAPLHKAASKTGAAGGPPGAAQCPEAAAAIARMAIAFWEHELNTPLSSNDWAVRDFETRPIFRIWGAIRALTEEYIRGIRAGGFITEEEASTVKKLQISPTSACNVVRRLKSDRRKRGGATECI